MVSFSPTTRPSLFSICTTALLLLGSHAFLSSSESIIADSVISPSYQCPSYGCPVYPLDVISEDIRLALSYLEGLGTQSSSPPTTDTQEGENGASSVVYDSLFESARIERENDDKATLTLKGYKGGDPDKQINQDRSFIVHPYQIKNDNVEEGVTDGTAAILLGVFDGHGNLGEVVSEYTVTEFPTLLSSKITSDSTVEQVSKALKDSFIELDGSVPTKGVGGCTASVILQIASKIYIANAGDSQSVIATFTKSTREVKVVYKSREDKPHLPEERERVEKMGGKVYLPPNPEGSSRVIYVNPKTGGSVGLAMSRSIGDWDHGNLGVIPDPIVDVLDVNDIIGSGEQQQECHQNEEDDEQVCSSNEADVEIFAISMTDGMLDAMTPEEVAQIIGKQMFWSQIGDDHKNDYLPVPQTHLVITCQELILKAMQVWYDMKNGRYRDDIAIAVSKLVSTV